MNEEKELWLKVKRVNSNGRRLLIVARQSWNLNREETEEILDALWQNEIKKMVVENAS